MFSAEELEQAICSDKAWVSNSLLGESSRHDKQEGRPTKIDCENVPFPVKGLKDEVHWKC
jgi:hypothetical protein